MLKYRMTVYYKTSNTEMITKYMRELIPEWQRAEREVIASRVWEWETDKPLTEEVIKKIKALKEDWMDEIIIEEVTKSPKKEVPKC